MLDWSQCRAVERIPGKVGGAWVFKGTRVPVKALFENLETGARVDDFLAWFPGVTRDGTPDRIGIEPPPMGWPTLRRSSRVAAGRNDIVIASAGGPDPGAEN